MGICQAIDFSFSVSASNRALRIKLTKYPQYTKFHVRMWGMKHIFEISGIGTIYSGHFISTFGFGKVDYSQSVSLANLISAWGVGCLTVQSSKSPTYFNSTLAYVFHILRNIPSFAPSPSYALLGQVLKI